MRKFNLVIRPAIFEFNCINLAKEHQKMLKSLDVDSSIKLINNSFVLLSNLTYKQFKNKKLALGLQKKFRALKIKTVLYSEIMWSFKKQEVLENGKI